jgi:polyhydroxybutyrate depolymerase
MFFLSVILSTLLAATPLTSGDHARPLVLSGQTRSYIVHVPLKYNAKPTPVVLAFHGAWTNAAIMSLSTGLNAKADEAGFLVVYPNGTGKDDLFLFWNSGG